MNKVGIFFIVMFLSIGCASEKTKVISGYITVKGNAPHSYIVIEDKKNHNEYKIKNAKAFNLAHRQREKLTMEVSWIKDAVGPGFPAVIKVVNIY
jgi:hypothetical protein